MTPEPTTREYCIDWAHNLCCIVSIPAFVPEKEAFQIVAQLAAKPKILVLRDYIQVRWEREMKSEDDIRAEMDRIERLNPQPGAYEREARIRREYRIEALEWVLNEG